MRIVRFTDEHGQTLLGQELESDLAQVLDGELFGQLTPTDHQVRIARRLAPLDPCNIFCVGANYLLHIKEGKKVLKEEIEIPRFPVVFMKPTTALCHPGQPIVIPKTYEEAPGPDYECELAVVIGPDPVHCVDEANALDAVFGYTAACDVSARWWQRNAGGQWIIGKGFDTFCPLGPVIVTKDEIPDPQDVTVTTHLNGKQMQHGHTSAMLFTVANIVSFLSRDRTLLPGTVILTGTPEGIGAARTPPIWLQPGDDLVIDVEHIGTLRHSVIASES